MDTMRIGTPEYMGPELISSRSGYDGKKVDVWAAGVLLYVMLVGMFPFETQASALMEPPRAAGAGFFFWFKGGGAGCAQ